MNEHPNNCECDTCEIDAKSDISRVLEYVQQRRIVAGEWMDRATAVDLRSPRSHRATAAYDVLREIEETIRHLMAHGTLAESSAGDT